MAQVRFQLVIFKTETIYARDSLIKPKKLILYVLPSQLKNNVVSYKTRKFHRPRNEKLFNILTIARYPFLLIINKTAMPFHYVNIIVMSSFCM